MGKLEVPHGVGFPNPKSKIAQSKMVLGVATRSVCRSQIQIFSTPSGHTPELGDGFLSYGAIDL